MTAILANRAKTVYGMRQHPAARVIWALIKQKIQRLVRHARMARFARRVEKAAEGFGIRQQLVACAMWAFKKVTLTAIACPVLTDLVVLPVKTDTGCLANAFVL